MRQKEDKEFSLMLNRIRIGMPTKQDIQQLNERIIETKKDIPKIENTTNKFIELKKTNPTIITLLPKSEDVDNFNKIMTEKLKINIVSLKASDTLPNQINFYNNTYNINKHYKAKKNYKKKRISKWFSRNYH